MPEQYKNDPPNLSVYDSMSSDALEEILRADAQKLDDDIDLDAILHITDLLEERARKNNERTVDVEAMLKKMPFYAEANTAEAVCENDCAAEPEQPTTQMPTHRKRRKTHKILRLCAAVAAVVCMLFLVSGVASAFGFNFWSKLALWTDEVFGVVSKADDVDMPINPKAGTEALSYGSLQEALDEIGIDAVREPDLSESDLVPVYMDVVDTETDIILFADYFAPDNNRYISVSIRKSNDHSADFYEKTNDLVEAFVVADTLCYAFLNNENQSVVWMIDEYECSIIGTIPMDEMKEIVFSMIEHREVF